MLPASNEASLSDGTSECANNDACKTRTENGMDHHSAVTMDVVGINGEAAADRFNADVDGKCMVTANSGDSTSSTSASSFSPGAAIPVAITPTTSDNINLSSSNSSLKNSSVTTGRRRSRFT
jgi:hypothetical protein